MHNRKRTTHKYHLKVGKRTAHVIITKDLERREREHPAKFDEKTRIVQQGRRIIREAALAWEDGQLKNVVPAGP